MTPARGRNAPTAAVLLTLAVAVPSAAGCGGDTEQEGGDESAPTAPAVSIKDFKFAPAEIEVDVSTTVRWTNEDKASHTASSEEAGIFDTGTIRTGRTKTATFRQPGTINYICQFHPFMKGKVIVR